VLLKARKRNSSNIEYLKNIGLSIEKIKLFDKSMKIA